MKSKRPYKPSKEELLENAAHLVAAISDKTLGLKKLRLQSHELQDSFNILRMELGAAGYLEKFRLKNGRIGIKED